MKNNEELLTTIFLKKVSKCSCGLIEWITVNQCPGCNQAYGTTNESREKSQQYLIKELESKSDNSLYAIFTNMKKDELIYGRKFDF